MTSPGERIALDVHAHLVPVEPAKLTTLADIAWNAEEKTLNVDGHPIGMKPLFDPPALVRWMDDNRVEQAWISIPPPLYRPHLQGEGLRAWIAYVNDGLEAIAAQYPRRLVALPFLPLQAPAIANEVARAWIARGCRRFAAPSGGYGEAALSSADYDPLWESLHAAKAFVFFHPGECADGRLNAFYLSNLLGNPYETAVAIGHLVFAGVFERYDGIRFCFAHGGGALPMLAGRFERGFDTARPGIDTKRRSPLQALRNVCVDCIVHDAGALALAEQVFGENNVVFGSDWPFPMGLVEPHRQMAGLDGRRRARILCDNPTKLATETTS
jgi:aminocarboxymuconate-semialdehyde decarboxylase